MKGGEGPVWLSRAIVVALHANQLREHGGARGLRDEGMLDSALARPLQTFSYDPEADLARLAAEYGFGLARNHPFIDGNKRTAFLAMNVFLLLNGQEIDAPEPTVVDVMLRLADGRLEVASLAEWIRSTKVPSGAR